MRPAVFFAEMLRVKFSNKILPLNSPIKFLTGVCREIQAVNLVRVLIFTEEIRA